MNIKKLNSFEYLSDEESQLITGGSEDSMFIFIVDGEDAYERPFGAMNKEVFLKNFSSAERLVHIGILNPVEVPQ